MPNWCNGIVNVKGRPEDIEGFCELFVFDEEANKENSKFGKNFFARSFIHESWSAFKKNHLGGNEAEFSVDFAWSGYSCLIDGYPTRSKETSNGFEKCVTLGWACEKYNVVVEIDTEEGGEGFEEHITADKDEVNHSSKDMPTYECVCGNKQMFPSSYSKGELEDEECCECERVGKWFDELTEIIKEKIERSAK